MIWTYIIIAGLLLAAELLYVRIADRCNIIDKPNGRSSHTKVVLRGGGVIFTIGLWVWSAFFGFQYPWLLAAVTLAAGVSFFGQRRNRVYPAVPDRQQDYADWRRDMADLPVGVWDRWGVEPPADTDG